MSISISDLNFNNQEFKSWIFKGFAMFLNLEQFKDVGFFDENFLFIWRR